MVETATKRLSCTFLLVGTVVWGGVAEARLEGRVVGPTGEAIELARIEIPSLQSETVTDEEGSFVFANLELPVDVLISHPHYQEDLRTVDSSPVELELEPREEVFEEIAVSATRGPESFAPVTVASSAIDPAQTVQEPTHLTALVAETPGVSQNGQGGIFQTYSVRGVSRQRVATLISGMRIVSERRAGVSASFLDPRLMGRVDVVRGPASTYYGSGALGGVVQMFPRRFHDHQVYTGFDSEGDGSYLTWGWGDPRWSLGIATRRASDAEAPTGESLHSGFEQLSGAFQRQWDLGPLQIEGQVLFGRGRDIAKANTDFPERQTDYPEENHLLVRVAVESDKGWSLEAWAHPNDLETRVQRPDRIELLDNEAFNFGINYQKSRSWKGVQARAGVDYFGRRGVRATQVDRDLQQPGAPVSLRQTTLDGAGEDEFGVFGAIEGKVGPAQLLGGGRLVLQRQGNGAGDLESTAVSTFAGAVVPLAHGFELAANLGSGLRFPSLSERFFTGVTGRGNVTGNVDLDSERSLSADLGLRWTGDSSHVALYVFRNEIDDYIERVEIAPDELTFVNLTEGKIEGLELDGFARVHPAFLLSFGAQRIEGEDRAGGSLADIPANRWHLGGRWERGRWVAEMRWEHRQSKTDVGSGEKPIPQADLASASVRYQIRPDLALALYGRNLLDETYFNSADDKVTLSPRRSVGLGVAWTGDPVSK